MAGPAGGSAPFMAGRELPLPTAFDSFKPPKTRAPLRTLSTCRLVPHSHGLLSAAVQRT